jgi:hypothetical protein
MGRGNSEKGGKKVLKNPRDGKSCKSRDETSACGDDTYILGRDAACP